MGKIYRGSTEVNDIKLGDTQINKVYRGSSLVWEKDSGGGEELDFDMTVIMDSTASGSFGVGAQLAEGTTFYMYVNDILKNTVPGDNYMVDRYVTVSGGDVVRLVMDADGNMAEVVIYGTTEEPIVSAVINAQKNGAVKFTFINCNKLKTVDISDIDTSLMWNFNSMFAGSTILECINGTLDTTNAGNIAHMFDNCPALIHPDSTEQAALMAAGGSIYTYTSCSL